MNRCLRLCIPGLIALWSSLAAAQTRTVTMTVEGVDFADAETPFVNKANCVDPSTTDIELNVPTFTGTTAYIYLTIGATDCKVATNRDESTDPCKLVFTDISLDSPVTFHLSDLTASGIDLNCTSSASTGTTYTLWILSGTPVNNQDFTGENGNVDFKVDVSAPTAPTDLPVSRSGESFNLSWNDGNSGEVVDSFRVYKQTGTVDQTSCTCTGMCLQAGMAATSATPVASPGSTSVTISASTLGLALGDKTQLLVSGVDLAGNEGVLSAPVCVQHVMSAGFCDVQKANGFDCPNGCSASEMRGHTTKWIWFPLASLIAAAVWVNLRRKNFR